MGRPDLIDTPSSEAAWRAWLKSIPLRVKLITTFLILSTLTIITVAFISSHTTTRTLDEIIGEQLHDLATSRAHAVGDLLTQQVSVIETLSLQAPLRAAAIAARDRYTGDSAAIEAELLSLNQQWLAAANDDPLIREILDNPLAADLRLFQTRFPKHVETLVTDRYGALLAATGRPTGYYLADEAWWQSAYQHGQGATHLTGPEFDDSAGMWSLRIAVPIYTQDQTTAIGVLATTYHVYALNAVLTATMVK